jgi:hypothetical protein
MRLGPMWLKAFVRSSKNFLPTPTLPPIRGPRSIANLFGTFRLSAIRFLPGGRRFLGRFVNALVSTGRAAFSRVWEGSAKLKRLRSMPTATKTTISIFSGSKPTPRNPSHRIFAQLGSILNLAGRRTCRISKRSSMPSSCGCKQHEQWLLILDNADDLSLIHPFIQGLQSGHILLTTRAQATGTISRVEVRKLPEQEGTDFSLYDEPN